MRTNLSSSAPDIARDKPFSQSVNEDLLALFERGGKPVYRLYEPESVCLVLGAGRKVDEDVFTERARTDGVAILRRRGGGGTVVLTPGQVVLALVTEVASPFHNLEYFRIINDWFRRALDRLGVAGIEDRGISDLAVGERKILGTSLYRRRNVLFYQASLLVDVDLALFERYLSFPSRVPEYRRQRGHLEFCTTLRREGCVSSVTEVLEAVRQVVETELPRLR
jgi:lipoate-protein ligase A